MAEIKYEIKNEIGVLSSSPKSGWQKEVNMVSWNDNPAKMDIRDWAPDHERMRKGITLTCEEAKVLKEYLDSVNFDELFEN